MRKKRLGILVITLLVFTTVGEGGDRQKELTKMCRQGDAEACQELSEALVSDQMQKLDRMQDARFKRALKDMQSRDADKRIEAAENLGDYEEPEAIEALRGALKDDDARVRETAASSLWRLSDVAAIAESELRAALDDPAPGVKIRAAGALAALGVEDTELLETYRQVLKTGDTTDRFLAARVLIGHDDGLSLLPSILEFARAQAEPADSRFGGFSDGQETNQELAANALERLAQTQQRDLIPPLIAAIDSPPWMRSTVLETLGIFDPDPDGWVDLLTGRLTDKALQHEAIRLLGERSSDPVDVSRWAPKVAEYIGSSPNWALQTLGKAGGLAHEALPAVLLALDSSDDGVRNRAAEVVGEICDRTQSIAKDLKRSMAEAARPALIAALQKESEKDTRRNLIRSFMKLELDPEQQQPFLVELLQSDEPREIEMALKSLGDLGWYASSATRAIEPLIEHEDSAVQNWAEWTLKAIQESSPQATPSAASASTPSAIDPAREQRGLAMLQERGLKFDDRTFERSITSVEPEIVEAFLDAGMSADYRFSRLGFNTLHTLLHSNNACDPKVRPTPEETKRVLKLLLERGAEINARHEGGGNTPLMFALRGCDGEVVRILLDAGADPNLPSKTGSFPYSFVLLYRNESAVDGLVGTGYRLPNQEYAALRQSYADNPEALVLIERAAPGAGP